MKNIFITSLFGLGIASGGNAFALPCAQSYGNYRETLISQKYQLLPCSNENAQDKKYPEICREVIGRGVGYLDLVNPDYNSMRVFVNHIDKKDHCITANYVWITEKENRTTRLQKILEKLDEMEDNNE